MPNYTIEGKRLTPISKFKFNDMMQRGKFITVPQHKALLAILYYFGFRISEALSLKTNNFTLEDNLLYVTVQRLKHSRNTEALSVPIDRPYVNEILETLEATPNNKRLFPYSRVTGWRIVRRALNVYPHFLRLNRITHLFMPSPAKPSGYSITEVRSFTGLTVNSLNAYVGRVSVKEIGTDLE